MGEAAETQCRGGTWVASPQRVVRHSAGEALTLQYVCTMQHQYGEHDVDNASPLGVKSDVNIYQKQTNILRNIDVITM